MDLLQLELGDCFEHLDEIEAAIAHSDANRGLGLYLRYYPLVVARAQLEWSLAALLLRTGRVDSGIGAWPEDLLARPSGACLAFVWSQLEARDLPLPGGLARLAPIPSPLKGVLAKAWLHRPGCWALADERLRQRFAFWLAEENAAIGNCLVAAARCRDQTLVSCLVPLWLRRGLREPETADVILQASQLGPLRRAAGASIRISLSRFFDDDQALNKIAEAAFHLENYPLVVAISNLLVGDHTRPEIPQKTLALRLVALAETGRHEDLVAEYRRHWLASGWSHPEPQRLLYLFQQLGERELEVHLLETSEITAQTPRWVQLARKLHRLGRTTEGHLRAWEELYRQEYAQEPVLVGLTTAILRSPQPLRAEWAERLRLRERWQKLATHDSVRHLAGAYLVLLAGVAEERIEAFEAWLADVPLTHGHVKKAARAYIAALRQTRQWSRLGELEEQRSAPLLHACPFEEREFARMMTHLAHAPESPAHVRGWCEGWERLLSLPLQSHEVVEVLDHFCTLRRVLEQHGCLAGERELYEDITLQILRRGKAEAEARLAAQDPAAWPANARARLDRAGPEATFRLLQELLFNRPGSAGSPQEKDADE